MSTTFEVKGKSALVTGANRGIGKSIVETFLQNGAKKVYAAARNVDSLSSLVEKYREQIVPLHVDLEDPETIKQAAKKAHDVEIVVNNAGVLRLASPLDEDAIEKLSFEININVFGLMRMAQAFAPVLKTNGGGVFVQLNSVASIKSFADFATYAASKAAAYSITQALRDVLVEQGTLVISVHPGPMDTDMAAKAGLGDMAESPKIVAEGIIDSMRKGQFHLFPGQMARTVGSVYQRFAEEVIEGHILEG